MEGLNNEETRKRGRRTGSRTMIRKADVRAGAPSGPMQAEIGAAIMRFMTKTSGVTGASESTVGMLLHRWFHNLFCFHQRFSFSSSFSLGYCSCCCFRLQKQSYSGPTVEQPGQSCLMLGVSKQIVPERPSLFTLQSPPGRNLKWRGKISAFTSPGPIQTPFSHCNAIVHK